MELFNKEEFEVYIKNNYPCIYENVEPEIFSQISGVCDYCQKAAFLKIHSKSYSQSYFKDGENLPFFVTYFLECPNCRRQNFIKTVRIFTERFTGRVDEDGDEEYEGFYEFYKLMQIPTIEEIYTNKEIPEEYVSLKESISEASFCLSNSKNIAAAILFRRAIQILVKDILGAVGKNLYQQLEWLKTNNNKLNVNLLDVFHDNAKIIKNIGNQGAHPDDDISLHNFSKEDAERLHDLFISIIYEVFIKPAKLKAIQEDLKKSRKLN